MSDAHIDVVHHHAELIGRQAGRTQEYEVFDFGVLHVSRAEDGIFKMGRARARSAKTNCGWGALFFYGSALCRRQVAARASDRFLCLALVVTSPFVLFGRITTGISRWLAITRETGAARQDVLCGCTIHLNAL